MLTQQVREPLEDPDARASIPRLTPITDGVSLQVQQQYEENPFPRWVRTASMVRPTTLDVYLHRQLPLAPMRELGKRDGVQILIAGCGTGQHSIETVQRLIGVETLAVDLSLTSLCYAQRKSRALGLTNLHYAQADIMQLGAIGRTFDLIEAGGVLHHLADPLAGWRVLVSLLRPRAIMRVGLCSELARSDLRRRAGFHRRARLWEQRRRHPAVPAGADGDRKRNGFEDGVGAPGFLQLERVPRFAVPSPGAPLHAAADRRLPGRMRTCVSRLRARRALLGQFRRRFPDPDALADLDLWHAFETENPRTFIGMYQFFVQRA